MIRRLAARLFRAGWFRLARLASRFAPTPTDRAHLLIAPEQGDACDSWRPASDALTVPDCETDGHYLCAGCACRRHG